eukprot:gene4114-4445_t
MSAGQGLPCGSENVKWMEPPFPSGCQPSGAGGEMTNLLCRNNTLLELCEAASIWDHSRSQLTLAQAKELCASERQCTGITWDDLSSKAFMHGPDAIPALLNLPTPVPRSPSACGPFVPYIYSSYQYFLPTPVPTPTLVPPPALAPPVPATPQRQGPGPTSPPVAPAPPPVPNPSRSCTGARDGKSGCRDCCQNEPVCVDACMEAGSAQVPVLGIIGAVAVVGCLLLGVGAIVCYVYWEKVTEDSAAAGSCDTDPATMQQQTQPRHQPPPSLLATAGSSNSDM